MKKNGKLTDKDNNKKIRKKEKKSTEERARVEAGSSRSGEKGLDAAEVAAIHDPPKDTQNDFIMYVCMYAWLK